MGTNIRVFRKTVRKREPLHHPLLALDIENNPVTGAFINAGVYGEVKYKSHGNYKIKHIEAFFTNQEEFTDFLMDLRKPNQKEIPTKIILFNASYDYWFLMKITKDDDLLTNGSNIITGKLKNGIPIMDLTNLTRQGSLEDWIGHIKEEMNKYGLYKKESLEDLEKRVKSDVKATWILGNYLENFFVKEMGIPLKLTIASAARYLFSLRFFTDYWQREEKDLYLSEYERKAYRGGRVEAFIRGKEDIKGYDVNSMYLSVMQKELIPDPNSAKYVNYPPNLPKNTLYIADVTVKVPKQHIPPLPTIDPETKKLIFPIGTFRGHFASPELDYAIKECGVKIIKIHSYIKYKGKHYFKDYAEFIWKKRKEYKDKHNKGMDILIKYLGNTLYGGFGQKNKETFFGKLEDLSLTDRKEKLRITNINGVKYVTTTTDEGEDSKHTFPCVPVFIASYARVLLLKALRANSESLIYTDTDSMKLRKEAIGVVIGDGLGEWGYEGEEKGLDFYKPKMYGDKCKGVPKRAKLVFEDKTKKIFEYEKPNKMRESFRRGLMPALWNKITKEVSKIDDKRIWINDKESLPPELDISPPAFKEASESIRQKAYTSNHSSKSRTYRQMRETDYIDEDSTLRRTEKEEDMINEMKRYMN